MTESARFFDLHGYTEADFAEVLHRIRRDGVITDAGNRLAVTVGGGFATVASGEAFVQGFWYQNTAPIPLAIANNASATVRNDLVVLRLDRTANTMVAAIHQGVVDGSTTLPTQIAGAVWEFVLATISTSSGVSTVVDGRTYSQQVSDGREITATLDASNATANVTQQRLVIDPATRLLQWAAPKAETENLLINSSLRVNQRGTGITSTSNIRVADCWTFASSDAVMEGSRDGSITPYQVANFYVPFSLKLRRTNSNAFSGSSYNGGWVQTIEANKWGRFSRQPLVCSLYTYSSKPLSFTAVLRNYGATRSFYHTISTTLVNTWEYWWFRIPPDSASYASWVEYGTVAAATLVFFAYAGPTYQGGTPDIWNAGNLIAPAGFANNFNTNNDTLYIATPKIEVGMYPSRWAMPDVEVDERECYRQLWVAPTGQAGVGNFDSRKATAYGTAQFNIDWDFPVPMRAMPVFTCPGLTAIQSTLGANGVHFESQRLTDANAITGTYSSHTSWEPGFQHHTTRLNSSVAYGNVAAGDVAYAYFGSAVQPTFSAELS